MVASRLTARRIGLGRAARVEWIIANAVAARSARVLTDAADAVLTASATCGEGGIGVAAVAETLMQRAAVQDLLVSELPAWIVLGDRLGSLAGGLVDASSRLCEIRMSAPRLSVPARLARWLTAVSLELIEGLGADLAYGRGAVLVRLEIREGVVVIAVTAGPLDGSRPSLRINPARTMVEAMGGRLREVLEPHRRSVSVTLPSLLSRLPS